MELIRATAAKSETRMPLNNLLVVFCPSLNMTPPLLKVLCEAEGIWGGMYGDDEDGEDDDDDVGDVIDIRRQTMPARSPTADGAGFFTDELSKTAMIKTTTMTMEEGSESASLDTTDNNPSSDYHASAEESIYDDEYEMLGEVAPRRRVRRDGVSAERREEVPTVYLDCSSRSASSLACQEDQEEEEEEEPMSMTYLQDSRETAARDDDGSISSGNYSMHAPSPPPLLSSSSDSVATPMSSGNPSFAHLPLEHEHYQEKEERDHPRIHAKDHQHQRHQGSGPEIVDVTPLELRVPPSQMQTQTSKRPVISNPIPISIPVRFPTSATPPPQLRSGGAAQTQTQASKRPVISNPIPIPVPVQFPTSPTPPPQHRSGGAAAATLKRRSISIPMLSLPNFSSTQQTPTKEKGKGSPSRTPSPMGSPRLGMGASSAENVKSLNRSKKPSLKLLFSKRSASSLTGVGERDRSNSVGGGMPFISAPIPHQGHAASMVSLSPRTWSPKFQHQQQEQEQQQTPPMSAASDSNSSVSTPVSAVTAPQSQAATSSVYSLPPVLDTPIEGASFEFDLEFGMGLTTTPAMDATLDNSRPHQQIGNNPPPLPPSNVPVIPPLSLTHRKSNLSIASTASSNHLSLFDDDDDDEGMEEWTQSVLLAADVDVGAVQKAP